MTTVYEELADRLRGLVADVAPQVVPPVQRGIVRRSSPLVIDLGDEMLLEEGDPDVEFDRGLLSHRPAAGAAVRVHCDGDDYVVAGVVLWDPSSLGAGGGDGIGGGNVTFGHGVPGEGVTTEFYVDVDTGEVYEPGVLDA